MLRWAKFYWLDYQKCEVYWVEIYRKLNQISTADYNDSELNIMLMFKSPFLQDKL